jgi:hypothetical protein
MVMKVFIIHDDAGRIRGTLAVSSKTPNVGMKPVGGLRVFVTEAAEMDDAELQRFIHDLHNNHQVNMTVSEPLVVRTKTK